ncbi:MAG: chemotaxis protein CheW, partial [Lachnospiraceae bacterium]
IVDEVREVVTLDADSIEKVSYDANDEKSLYLAGIGKHNDNLISLLNIAGVIVEKEKEKEA